MMKIPEWQYPLYKESDRLAYSVLEKLGRSKNYPKLVGTEENIKSFLKLLLISQKMKDYRKFRGIVLSELKKNEVDEVDIPKILDQGKTIEITRGVDKSWAVFIQDNRICELIDEFNDSNTEFQGSNDKTVEFIVRFLLSQLLQDWRGPLMAVLLQCLEFENVRVSELNELLKIWDYTKIF